MLVLRRYLGSRHDRGARASARAATAPTPAPAPAPAIELDHVSRWYGNVVAVNDISFAPRSGVTGLLGPNGAGKSTLLHLCRACSPHRPARPGSRAGPRSGDPSVYRHIGLVPGTRGRARYLTGREFRPAQRPAAGHAGRRGAAERAIATVDLDDAAHRQLRTYSKGMRQRAKLAGALVHEPHILLLDEPFNGMDPRQRLHMIELLRAMAAEGRVILFSSHILEEVERLADSVLVVYAGRLAASGDFRSIRRLMTDRPHTFTVRSSDDRPLASALLANPSVFGAELVDGSLAVRTSDYGAFTRIAADRTHAGHQTPRARPDRRLARERLQLPGPPMTVMATLAGVTLRGLLGRRRMVLMVLLAGLPVLVGLLIRLGGGRADAPEILDTLVIRTVLPLIALVVGTAAIGSEVEDGTLVYLLVKPIDRWRVALAKLLSRRGSPRSSCRQSC